MNFIFTSLQSNLPNFPCLLLQLFVASSEIQFVNILLVFPPVNSEIGKVMQSREQMLLTLTMPSHYLLFLIVLSACN